MGGHSQLPVGGCDEPHRFSLRRTSGISATAHKTPETRDAIDPDTCACNHLHMNADNSFLGFPDPEYIELAVAVFSMLAEPTRVRIILALRDRELSVGRSPRP